jgi:hypothetical protein
MAAQFGQISTGVNKKLETVLGHHLGHPLGQPVEEILGDQSFQGAG